MSREVLSFPLSDGLCPEPSNSLYFAYTWSHSPLRTSPHKGPREYLGKRAVSGSDLLRNLLFKQPASQRAHIGAALILKQCVHKSHPNDVLLERVGMYVNANPSPGQRTSYQINHIDEVNENDLAFVHLTLPGAGVPNCLAPPITNRETLAGVAHQVVRTETPEAALYVVERGPIEFVRFRDITASRSSN